MNTPWTDLQSITGHTHLTLTESSFDLIGNTGRTSTTHTGRPSVRPGVEPGTLLLWQPTVPASHPPCGQSSSNLSCKCFQSLTLRLSFLTFPRKPTQGHPGKGSDHITRRCSCLVYSGLISVLLLLDARGCWLCMFWMAEWFSAASRNIRMWPFLLVVVHPDETWPAARLLRSTWLTLTHHVNIQHHRSKTLTEDAWRTNRRGSSEARVRHCWQ